MSGRPINRRVRLLLKWSSISIVALALLYWPLARLTAPDQKSVAAANADVEGLTSILNRNVDSRLIAVSFEDVSANIGIDFQHFPAVRRSLLPEDMGSGIACGDFDDDGFPDLYFVNFSGSVHPGETLNSNEGRNRLYRNVDGDRFEDVTDSSGLGLVGFGMGAAWGDFDNDGDLDLYVTAYGANTLFRNRGDGTFEDVTEAAGVQDERFSTGCMWGDYDRDGNIDLYVCNYVDFRYDKSVLGKIERQYSTEQPYTLNPSSYRSQGNTLFRNRGDGTFEEVGMAAGVVNPESRSLSASWADLNNDGWIDLYIANDVSKNDVYLNKGDGTFEDIGASSLAADYRGAMGIAVGDFDNDTDHDLLVSHWIAQENALYYNMLINQHGTKRISQERLWFVDAADQFGLGQISLDMIGWATGFCDFDNDGRRDLWLVNGSTFEDSTDHANLIPQPPFVFWNQGEGGFADITAIAAKKAAKPFVGRGGAHLDFDRDGKMDLIMGVHGGKPIILHNTSSNDASWLRLRLRQQGHNTQALGTRIYLTANNITQMAEVGCSSSYLSQDDPTVHFGIGNAAIIDELRIQWPDGAEDIQHEIQVDQELDLTHLPQYPPQSQAPSL